MSSKRDVVVVVLVLVLVLVLDVGALLGSPKCNQKKHKTRARRTSILKKNYY